MGTKTEGATYEASLALKRRGAGGEVQQTASDAGATLTTSDGTPLVDNQNSLRTAPRGASLLEDFAFLDKLTHFDRERIPERVVHARGSVAKGYFELTHPLKAYTTAKVLTQSKVRTPVLARFSTVATPKRATGTWLATTFRCSSFRMR
jgi:catalase